MENNRYVIAFDLGTTGNKATLFDQNANLKESVFCEYKTYHSPNMSVEQDPEDWWKAVRDATIQLMEKGKVHPTQLNCVVFSGQMMGCVPVTKDGSPLGKAIIWADQRAVPQAERMINEMSMESIYRIVGHRPSPSYSAAKIMWLKDNDPDRYRQTYKFLHAKDFIVARMTGCFLTDYSDASGTNLLDLNELIWSKDMLRVSGISEDKLPELVKSTEIVGGMKEDIARELGLLAGTPVVIGGGDGPCAALGAGVIRPGTAYNYLGSSSWIGLATEKPVLDPLMRTFTWVHVIPGMYSPTGTMQAGGASYQWLKESLCKQELEEAQKGSMSLYARMDQLAQTVEPGADQLLYLPYLLGERSPYWNPNAKAAFIGLTINHKLEHMIRSVMEGVSFNLKVILDAFEEQGVNIEAIRLTGGGAKGHVWPQIMADIYQKDVLVAKHVDEATSMGAAIIGGVATGLYSDFNVIEKAFQFRDIRTPNFLNEERYAALYGCFKDSYQALVSVFKRL